jgi:hypothetical protein
MFPQWSFVAKAMTRKQSVTWCETDNIKNGGNQQRIPPSKE